MSVDKAKQARPSIISLEEAVLTNCDHRTPWPSIWMCIFMQFVIGAQISIYYMSMWPYLSGLDSTTAMHFLGWVVASCSIGCSLANPIFGYWNEKTMSVTWPTVCGFSISAVGQILYGLLPLVHSNIKWYMIAARFITGFGTGCISVLRAYIATAALPKDKLSAISYGTAGWVLGISFGPAIQALFTPIGSGWKVGFLILNMYTLPAFFMALVTVFSCIVILMFMTEDYAGIIDQKEQDANRIVIPKFDVSPALICVWLWIVSCSIATNIEVISTPLSTAMYGWNDSTSIFYNGIIESVTCVVSVFVNFLIGYSRIGQIDKRKQIIFGLAVFLLYHLINYPWSIYPGPLHYIPPGLTSSDVGGCDPSFRWCETSPRIPLFLYVFSFIVLYGIAFPFVGSPSASLYSEILGPRPQGMMQGMYSAGGSVAQFIAPILATFLFQHTGYIWVVVSQIGSLTLALVFMFVYYNRLVPLELKPAPGSKIKYSTGVLYAM